MNIADEFKAAEWENDIIHKAEAGSVKYPVKAAFSMELDPDFRTLEWVTSMMAKTRALVDAE